jgi:electron transport complex protein RnfG
LVPGADVGEKVFVEDEPTVRAYYRIDRQGSHFGYILDLVGTGYGGEMKILAAFKLEGEIVSARLLDNQETPGLGKKAEKDSYMQMFKGTGKADSPVPTSKAMIAKRTSAGGQKAPKGQSFRTWFLGQEAGGSADVITGATLTFLGVSRALSNGARYVREEMGGK